MLTNHKVYLCWLSALHPHTLWLVQAQAKIQMTPQFHNGGLCWIIYTKLKLYAVFDFWQLQVTSENVYCSMEVIYRGMCLSEGHVYIKEAE
jgi:hypothetical protein